MKHLGLLALGAILGVMIVYFAYTIPALNAADARVEAARDDLSEAPVVAVSDPDEGAHCKSVAVGVVDAYKNLRRYLIAEQDRAAAAGQIAAFAVWREDKKGDVVEIQAVPVDRVAPDRPDLYAAVITACTENPERFALPKANPQADPTSSTVSETP